MPEIARLGAVIIRVYADDARRHRQPHFHAVGPDEAMVVSLPSLTVIAGQLRRPERVIAWAQEPENFRRLIAAWNHGNPHHSLAIGRPA